MPNLQQNAVKQAHRKRKPHTSMTKFHITTHGCRVNRVESDNIAAALMAAGWEPAALEDADIAMLNTCTVTGEADHKNRKAIRQALKRQGGPVLVTGCAINIAADAYQAIDARVVCETSKEMVANRALDLMHHTVADSSGNVPYGEGFRTRSGVKVQDGCDNACTFCIVHVARGKARSVDPDIVISQARQLVDAGSQELVLVGIDTGAYRWGDMRLSNLVQRLMDETDVKRIRIPSIEPQSVTPDLISLMAQSDGRLCRHLHLVLQSGSSKVLHEMARHYDAAEFLELVRTIRAAVPNIALSTDIIVGFPGETQEDFEATCQMVKDCGFMKLHVFPYSKRPGTPAAARDDQVDPQVRAARVQKLTALGRELALGDMAARVGSTESVVVERWGQGTSESFHEVRFAEQIELGALVQMRFVGVDKEKHCLIATLA